MADDTRRIHSLLGGITRGLVGTDEPDPVGLQRRQQMHERLCMPAPKRSFAEHLADPPGTNENRQEGSAHDSGDGEDNDEGASASPGAKPSPAPRPRGRQRVLRG